MSPFKQEFDSLLADLREIVKDPADQQIVAAVAADATALGSRMLAGEDVSAALAEVKAQTLNLAAAKQVAVANRLNVFLTRSMTALVAGAFASAG